MEQDFLDELIGESTEKNPHFPQLMEEARQRHELLQNLVAQNPLFQVAGMFAIGEPGWANNHDMCLTDTYIDSHADSN